MDALFVPKIDIDHIFFFGLIGHVDRQIRLGGILYFSILQTFIVLILSIGLLYFFNIALTFNLWLFRLLKVTGFNLF